MPQVSSWQLSKSGASKQEYRAGTTELCRTVFHRYGCTGVGILSMTSITNVFPQMVEEFSTAITSNTNSEGQRFEGRGKRWS